MDVAAILGEPDRVWNWQVGATEQQIQFLLSNTPADLPDELIALLRFSNGGEGDLALPPLLFALDPVEQIVEGMQDPFYKEEFPGFLFFGGNGGLEKIAFDLRAGAPPWPVVMIDPIAGPESATVIAPDFAAFVMAIGHEHPEAEQED